MTGEKSVHLEEFPKADEILIDEKLLKKMEDIRKIASIGLELRAKAGIKVRQPLQAFAINVKLEDDYKDLLQEELNVKEILSIEKIGMDDAKWIKTIEGGLTVLLDINITPELKEEGNLREIIRNIQSLRKKAGLTPKDKIALCLHSDDEQINGIIEKNKEIIKKDTILANIIFEKQGDFKASEEIEVDGKKLFIGIK